MVSCTGGGRDLLIPMKLKFYAMDCWIGKYLGHVCNDGLFEKWFILIVWMRRGWGQNIQAKRLVVYVAFVNKS